MTVFIWKIKKNGIQWIATLSTTELGYIDAEFMWKLFYFLGCCYTARWRDTSPYCWYKGWRKWYCKLLVFICICRSFTLSHAKLFYFLKQGGTASCSMTLLLCFDFFQFAIGSLMDDFLGKFFLPEHFNIEMWNLTCFFYFRGCWWIMLNTVVHCVKLCARSTKPGLLYYWS